jgi:glycerol-3-phosphate dehydrogenase (NAD(P)+)
MKCALLGSWSWWTALAQVLWNNWNIACLWSIHEEEVEAINSHKSPCFPWVKLRENVCCSLDIKEVVKDSELIVLSLPSFALVSWLEKLKEYYDWQLIILATKWWRSDVFLPFTTLIQEVLWKDVPVVVLSWASHAEEVVRGIPTWVVLCSENKEYAEKAKGIFQNNWFRCGISSDVVWIQLCWALKNVLAIACWLVDWLEYGINTKALVFREGIKEIQLIGEKVWIDMDSLLSYAWIGDLYVTCSSSLSRNWNAWNLIAKWEISLKEKKFNNMVCEGLYMIDILEKYLKSSDIYCPLFELLIGIVKEWKDARSSFEEFLLKV